MGKKLEKRERWRVRRTGKRDSKQKEQEVGKGIIDESYVNWVGVVI